MSIDVEKLSEADQLKLLADMGFMFGSIFQYD